MPNYYQCIIQKGEEWKMKTVISTRLRPETQEIIKVNAQERGITVADWYRHAVLEEMKKQNLVPGGKHDTSTNAQESNQ